MGDWPRFFHAHSRPATGTVHPKCTVGLECTVPAIPIESRGDLLQLQCNKRPRARPGKCTGLGSAAASGLPRPGSRPHRTVATPRSVDAPRATDHGCTHSPVRAVCVGVREPRRTRPAWCRAPVGCTVRAGSVVTSRSVALHCARTLQPSLVRCRVVVSGYCIRASCRPRRRTASPGARRSAAHVTVCSCQAHHRSCSCSFYSTSCISFEARVYLSVIMTGI